MQQSETDQQKVAGEAASYDASGGPAADDSSENAAAAGTASDLHVLARVPDVETTDGNHQARSDSYRTRRRRDGRVIGQGLSTKLLAGAAVVLVLSAVVPWLFPTDDAGGDQESWRPEVPAPDAAEAPLWSGITPGPSSDPTDAANVPLQMNVPTPPTWPSATQDAADSATRPQAGVWGAAPHSSAAAAPNMPLPDSSYRGHTAWQGQASASAWPNGSHPPTADPRVPGSSSSMGAATANPYYQPAQYGVTGGPAAYRPHGHGNYPPTVGAAVPQARANQTMAIGNRPPVAPAGYSHEQRYHYSADTRNYPQTRYPTRWDPSTQAGVARFEGTIERPPVRTSYERARSSIH